MLLDDFRVIPASGICNSDQFTPVSFAVKKAIRSKDLIKLVAISSLHANPRSSDLRSEHFDCEEKGSMLQVHPSSLILSKTLVPELSG